MNQLLLNPKPLFVMLIAFAFISCLSPKYFAGFFEDVLATNEDFTLADYNLIESQGSSKNRWTSKQKRWCFHERGQRNKAASESGDVNVGESGLHWAHGYCQLQARVALHGWEPEICWIWRCVGRGSIGPPCLLPGHQVATLYSISASGNSAWPISSRECHLWMGNQGFEAARAWAAQTELRLSHHPAPPCLAAAQRGQRTGCLLPCSTAEQGTIQARQTV